MGEEMLLRLGLRIDGFQANRKKATDETKEFQKNWQDMGKVIGAGGLTAAVVSFFRTAIDHARDAKTAQTEHTAAVREFGDGIDYLTGKAKDSAVFVTGTFNKLGSAIGEAINIARQGWGAWAEGQDKLDATAAAAERAEKALAETKKHAAEFNQISAKLKAAEEQRHDILLKGLTAQERVNQLANELAVAEKKLAESSGNALEQRRAQLEVETKKNDLLTAQNDLTKQQADERKKSDAEAEKSRERLAQLDEKAEAFLRSELSARGQLNALRNDELDLQLQLRELDQNSVEYAEAFNRLLDVRGQLGQAEKKVAEETRDIAALMLKGEENLTALEKEKLALLRGETTERRQQEELSRLLEIGVANLTDAERKRLQVLIGQTAEQQKQTAAVAERVNLELRRVGAGNGDLSDRQLTEKIDNLKQDIFNRTLWMRDNGVSYDPFLGFNQSQLDTAQRESDLRSRARALVPKLGESTTQTILGVDAAEFERILKYVTAPDAAKESKDLLKSIDRQLTSVFGRV